MKKSLVVLALAVTASLSVWSQGTPPAPKVVGKLVNVEGLVTVSAGESLANVVSGAPLIVGNRIITTSSGAVTLNFDNGCDIRLKANQSITVNNSNDCAAILAAVRPPVAVTVAAAGAGAGGGAAAGAGLGAGQLIPAAIIVGGTIAVIARGRSSNNTSPN